MPKVTVQLPNREPLVAGGHCAPCAARTLDAQALAAQQLADGTSSPAPADVRWEGVVCQEGVATGDGRIMAPGSLRWDTLPLPLRWDEHDDGEHAGAVVVGLIETLERLPNGDIWGTGYIDASGRYGQEVLRLMRKGMLRKVSVDLDDLDIEVRVKESVLEEAEAEVEAIFAEDEDDAPAPEREVDADGYVKVAEYETGQEMMVYLDARIRGATLLDISAFQGAIVQLVEPDAALLADGDAEEGELEALAAAAAPLAPPAAWFADPQLPGPTALTITDEGRVFGHIALWDSCHIGYKKCVSPPRSKTGYAWFLTGVTVTAEGTHVPTGHYTFQTGHAPARASAAAAAAHYDNTGTTAADLNVGEDEHGIWVAGALRSTLTPEQIRELRAAPASGDWRDRAGNLELVGLLGVNIPGFPVPRPRALVAGGFVQYLRLPAPEIPDSPVPALPQPGPSPALRRKTLLRRLKGN